jgi:hypothetical protein
MDITKINEIIIKLGKFKKPGFHIFKSNSIEIVLNIIKKGDVLGLITIDEKHFCDCVCISKFCSYFAIDFSVVENLMKKYEGIRKKLDEIKISRKKIIIDRLKNVKKVYKKTIFGEFRDNLVNKIEVGYKKKIDVKNLFYDEIENKIKRIKSNKNFFLKNVNVNINKFNEVFNNNKSRNVKNFNFNTNSDIFKSKNYLSPFSTNYSIFSNNSKKIINKKTQIFYNKILTTSNENNKSSFENKFFKTEKKIIKNLKRNASDFNNEEKQKKYLNKINNYFYNKNNNNKINFIDFLIFEKQKEKLTKSNKNIQKKRPFSSDFNKIPINFLINAKMKIIKKNIQKN